MAYIPFQFFMVFFELFNLAINLSNYLFAPNGYTIGCGLACSKLYMSHLCSLLDALLGYHLQVNDFIHTLSPQPQNCSSSSGHHQQH